MEPNTGYELENSILTDGDKVLITNFKGPDIRNTKIVDIYNTLRDYTGDITVYDPWADSNKVQHEYGIEIVNEVPEGNFDAVILGVAHKEFLSLDVKSLVKDGGVIYDVKGILPRDIIDGRL